MTQCETYARLALEQELEDKKMELRLLSYGVPKKEIEHVFSACLQKAVTTTYSRRELLELYCMDIMKFGKVHFSQFIFE
jgi:hypothetical protein